MDGRETMDDFGLADIVVVVVSLRAEREWCMCWARGVTVRETTQRRRTGNGRDVCPLSYMYQSPSTCCTRQRQAKIELHNQLAPEKYPRVCVCRQNFFFFACFFFFPAAHLIDWQSRAPHTQKREFAPAWRSTLPMRARLLQIENLQLL